MQNTLATVTSYQQRSDAILTHLLGRSYRATDVLFYIAGGAVALGAGAAYAPQCDATFAGHPDRNTDPSLRPKLI